MNFEPASYSGRLIAAIIDEIVIFLLPFYLYASCFGLNREKIDILGLSMFIVFCFKDIFGRSPGKYMLGLYIIDKNSGEKPKRINLFLRNITLLLGHFDGIVLFFNKNRQRIGDFLLSTVVVKEVVKEKKLPDMEFYKGATKERIKCIQCGSLIEEDETECKKCGWSYK